MDTETGYLYILDDSPDSSIMIFNPDGSFSRRLHRRGEGPGEYMKIDDFQVHNNEWIEVLDGRSQKLIRYELKSLNMISEVSLPFYASEYAYLESGNTVFFRNSLPNKLENEKYFYTILILDQHLELKGSCFPFDINFASQYVLLQPISLTNSEGRVFFTPFMSNIVYEILENSCENIFQVDLNKFDFAKSEFKFNSPMTELQFIMNNTDKYIPGIQFFYQRGDVIHFNFIYDKQMHIHFHDLKNRVQKTYGYLSLLEKEVLFPPPIASFGPTLVSVYSWDLLEKLPLRSMQQNSDLFAVLSDAVTKYQNPVLVTYTKK